MHEKNHGLQVTKRDHTARYAFCGDGSKKCTVPAGSVLVPVYSSSASECPWPLIRLYLRTYLYPCAVANNIVTVGSEGRGEILASLLDGTTTTTAGTPNDGDNNNINDHDSNTKNSSSSTTTTTRRSKRGFVTHTGTYNGVPVSIVLINMGYPNMDFFVREVRAVTTGPLRIVRLGSCAGLRPDLPVGSVAVASEGSVMIRQNPDAWEGTAARGETQGEPYLFHGVAPADEELSEALLKELKRSLDGKAGGGDGGGGTAVVGCLNASADSFYSSQGVGGVETSRSRARCSFDGEVVTKKLLQT